MTTQHHVWFGGEELDNEVVDAKPFFFFEDEIRHRSMTWECGFWYKQPFFFVKMTNLFVCS